MKQIFLDIDAVSASTTLGITSIRKMVREGSFPKPREIGARRVGWLTSEVTAWAESRRVANMLPPPSWSCNG